MRYGLVVLTLIALAGTVLSGCLTPTASAETPLHGVTPHGSGVSSQVYGYANFSQEDNTVTVRVEVWGLDTIDGFEPGPKGTHIHQNGECGPSFVDGQTTPGGQAGGHFNPDNFSHGKHAGDLGNMEVDEDGHGLLEVSVTNINLGSNTTHDVRGRSVVVHAGEDDLESQPSGAAGSRMLCGVIQ